MHDRDYETLLFRTIFENIQVYDTSFMTYIGDINSLTSSELACQTNVVV